MLQSKNGFSAVILSLVVSAGLLLAGCAVPPDQEMLQADIKKKDQKIEKLQADLGKKQKELAAHRSASREHTEADRYSGGEIWRHLRRQNRG